MADGFVEPGRTQYRGEPIEQPDQPGPPAGHMVLAAPVGIHAEENPAAKAVVRHRLDEPDRPVGLLASAERLVVGREGPGPGRLAAIATVDESTVSRGRHGDRKLARQQPINTA
jgi:hypothetical protein